ncbi:MAG: four-helix bundle copper-binding protein [Cyclobacteriaceae bacterium]
MDYQKNKDLVEELLSCSATCDYCAMACLDEKDFEKMRNCIKTNLICAELCRTTATAIVKGLAPAENLLKECIKACQKCAVECSNHTHQHCKDCASACEKCAESCKKAL